MNLCTNCGHPEEDHGPESGRWADGEVIPGRLCFWAENQGYSQDLCDCPGFNSEEKPLHPFEAASHKAGL